MKGAKLTKLRSALKKLPSFSKLDPTNSSSITANSDDSSTGEDNVAGKLHSVYVGKSRRRYQVSTEVVNHPLFQVLVDKSNGCDGVMSVACEVVLFDHLLWMLENAGSDAVSADEIVDLYSY
ncbi:hypothetical protein U1Q18_006339 [Sarracenia purpurea var. burkii]